MFTTCVDHGAKPGQCMHGNRGLSSIAAPLTDTITNTVELSPARMSKSRKEACFRVRNILTRVIHTA